MSIESVMPSNHLILCHPFPSCSQSSPASESFPMSRLFASGGQRFGASVSVLPMTIQDWLVWSPCCPRDSQEFSPTPPFKSINSLALSFLYSATLTSIRDNWKNHSFDYTSLCWGSDISAFEYAARFVIAFLPRSMRLLISWLQLPSAGILKSKKIKSFAVSIVSPSICHKVMGPESMILVFWMFSCKPAFSLWSFP